MGLPCSKSNKININNKQQQHSVATVEEVSFTSDEVNLLMVQWSPLNTDVSKYGSLLFNKLFIINGNLLKKFSVAATHDYNVKSTLNDARFLSHAKGIIQMIEFCIQLLHDDHFDDAVTALRQLGASHKHFRLKIIDLESFKEALLLLVAESVSDFSEMKTRAVWVKFFDFLLKQFSRDFHGTL